MAADDEDEVASSRARPKASRQSDSDVVSGGQTRRARSRAELLSRRHEELQASNAKSLGAEQRLESLSALVRDYQQPADEGLPLVQVEPSERQPLDGAAKLENVYILLAKKEKDLQLAAELGKVLLERNDELSKANERIAEEYSHKLELLEQEKHKLKRKLDQLEGEYENRFIELQTDCNILKNQLDQKDQSSRQLAKEKAKLIDDLVQQNQRLTRELDEATKSEELLSSQLEQVNERMSARLSNRLDHAAQVDALQDEIQILNQRKRDLERRLKLAQSDKLELSATIDESSDKILMLENLLNERDSRLAEMLIEVSELRDSGAWLAGKLESMISLNERIVSRTTGAVEDEARQLETLSERERSQLIEQLKELRLKTSSRIKASEGLLLLSSQQAAHKCYASSGSQLRARKLGSQGSCSIEEEDEEDEGHCASQSGNYERNSQDLIEEVYHMLRRFQLNLQQRREQLLQQQQQQQQVDGNPPIAGANGAAPYSPGEDSGILADAAVPAAQPVGSAAATASKADEWRQLLESLRALIDELPCSNCYLMIGERAQLERLQKAQASTSEELRRKNDQLLALESLKLEQSCKLEALEERCQTLSEDLKKCCDNGSGAREQMVQLAWKARDQAVGRKNAAEIALAKARIENMQISSQLMESVQQKGQLSQRLAQFEDDIHYMMQRSVKHKFTWEELKADERLRRARRHSNETTTRPAQQQAASGHSTTAAISNFGQSSIMQLSQLLNSIGAASRELQQPSDNTTATGSAQTSGEQPEQQQQQGAASVSESPEQSPNSAARNLFANIKANKFNLKFWQPKQVEASSEEIAPTHSASLASSLVAK